MQSVRGHALRRRAIGHRGKGVGKALLGPLIQAARDRKLQAIIGAIDADNKASIRLHAGFGFEKIGLFKRVGFKFDRWLDVVYMELLLQSKPRSNSSTDRGDALKSNPLITPSGLK